MRAMTSRPGRVLSVVLVTAMLLTLIAPGYAADKKDNGPIEVSSFTDASGSININVGKGEGISVGQKGVILRDGKQIADYQIVQVNWGFSRIEVSNVVSGYTVKAGDSAPIVSTSGSSTGKKKSMSKTILAILGIAAVAVLLGGRHRGGGGSSGDGTITITTQKTTNADGSGSVTITAKIDSPNGDPAPDGTSATFSSTAGTLSRTLVTTSAGRAVSTLTYDQNVGDQTATVTVKSLGSMATTIISFVSSIDLHASATAIQIRDSGGSVTESTITATCRDANSNPATSGDVQFTTSIGTIDPAKATIGLNGVATAKLTSTSSGTAVVTATWSKSRETIDIKITAGPPYSLEVNSSTGSLQCDGNSSATITATIKDVGGNLAADGTVVEFSVIPDGSGGGNGSITSPVATSNGSAITHLYSRDSGGAPSISGTAKVKTEVRRASQPSDVPLPVADLSNQNTTVQFIAVAVAEIHLAAEPVNVRGWDIVGNTTTLRAVVYNTDHQPAPNGTTVNLTSTHGIVANNGVASTTNGIATATLSTDASGTPGWDGYVSVTATSGGVTTTEPHLVIFSGPPSPTHSTANLSQTSIPKLHGQASITIVAHDINNNPIADGVTVTVTTDKGFVTAVGSGKTVGGNAIFSLTTSTDSANPTPTGSGAVNVSIDSSGTNPETGGAPLTYTLPFTVTD